MLIINNATNDDTERNYNQKFKHFTFPYKVTYGNNI